MPRPKKEVRAPVFEYFIEDIEKEGWACQVPVSHGEGEEKRPCGIVFQHGDKDLNKGMRRTKYFIQPYLFACFVFFDSIFCTYTFTLLINHPQVININKKYNILAIKKR